MTSHHAQTLAAAKNFPADLLGNPDAQLWVDTVDGSAHEDYDEMREETRNCLMGDEAANWLAHHWHNANSAYVDRVTTPMKRAMGIIQTMNSELGYEVDSKFTAEGQVVVTVTGEWGQRVAQEIHEDFAEAVIILTAKMAQQAI